MSQIKIERRGRKNLGKTADMKKYMEQYNAIKIKCSECDGEYLRSNKSVHNKTARHKTIALLKNQQQERLNKIANLLGNTPQISVC